MNVQQYADLSVVAAELESARRLLNEFATYEGSLTGHIAVVVATVRDENNPTVCRECRADEIAAKEETA